MRLESELGRDTGKRSEGRIDKQRVHPEACQSAWSVLQRHGTPYKGLSFGITHWQPEPEAMPVPGATVSVAAAPQVHQPSAETPSSRLLYLSHSG